MAWPEHSQAVEDPFHSLVIRLINLALWRLFLSPKWSCIPTHHSCLQVWSKRKQVGIVEAMSEEACEGISVMTLLVAPTEKQFLAAQHDGACCQVANYYPKNIYAVNAPFKEDGIFSCDINTKVVLTIWFDRKLDGGSYWHGMFFIYILKSCLAFLWTIY